MDCSDTCSSCHWHSLWGEGELNQSDRVVGVWQRRRGPSLDDAATTRLMNQTLKGQGHLLAVE